MKYTLILLLSLATLPTFAQTTDTTTYAQKDCEISASFPGGEAAWQRWLNHNMQNPEKFFETTVIAVQFRVDKNVDKNGNVSDIQVISGPSTDGYREEAVRLIKKSRLWTPAVLNGHQVNSWRTVNIEFPARKV